MFKVVVTKYRNDPESPTMFLGSDGVWYSISNKADFQKRQKEAKLQFLVKSDEEAKELYYFVMKNAGMDSSQIKISPELNPSQFRAFHAQNR